MKSTFSTIFYLKRQVVKNDGSSPVMGRITIDGTQTQFSCKLTVDAKIWDAKTGRATGRSTVALETNRMLDKIRVKINGHYQEIMDRDNFVTAEKVKNAFLGLEHRQNTLLKVFERFNEDYEKLYEAGMKSKSSLSKYQTVYKHLKEFIYQRYHMSDIALKELTPAFITDFDMFLRVDRHCCNNTVWIFQFILFLPSPPRRYKVVVVLVGGVLDAEAVNLSHFYRMGVGDAVGGDALLDFSALGDFDG